ncbi:hypothetical protein N7519_009958 [Penicillium mononematosum]|uniref:uncharacterized protein n=1 Tax=Penicillium mononematosum TaxID=268346 RepID=UPI00254982BA|nr:uncharacterized protein N7519_009958 [Penicillium mononematosum]KAJ6179497.1 hypothetical protein N7519_009958 [Penicillium mononematosum]
MLFGADIPCNVTKTSEGHERPLTCAWSSDWKPPWRSGNARTLWGQTYREQHLGLSATVHVARLVCRGALGEKAEPKFDVSTQSLKPLIDRTVEACDIFLPDDSFAVDGM